MCALDACYLGKFSKWTREAREAGERSRGSTECKESSHGAGGEKPTVEAFVGWEAATVTGKTRKREGILSQSAREEGVLRRWEVAMVLKTLETRGQRQGQKWVTASNVVGWKEGVSR